VSASRRAAALLFLGGVLAAGCLRTPRGGTVAENAPYLDPRRPAAERAADLVRRMTVAEKIAQTMTAAPAIPRLGVPAYDWWNEALHGVARAGRATVFPQAIALAATMRAGVNGPFTGTWRQVLAVLLLAGWIVSRLPVIAGHGDIEGKQNSWATFGSILGLTLRSSASRAGISIVWESPDEMICATAVDREGAVIRRWRFSPDPEGEADLLQRCVDTIANDPLLDAAIEVG